MAVMQARKMRDAKKPGAVNRPGLICQLCDAYQKKS